MPGPAWLCAGGVVSGAFTECAASESQQTSDRRTLGHAFRATKPEVMIASIAKTCLPSVETKLQKRENNKKRNLPHVSKSLLWRCVFLWYWAARRLAESGASLGVDLSLVSHVFRQELQQQHQALCLVRICTLSSALRPPFSYLCCIRSCTKEDHPPVSACAPRSPRITSSTSPLLPHL